MAVSDDDWKKFMDSTLEDDEEVETPEEVEDETDDSEEEDKNPKSNKSTEEEDDDTDDSEEDSDEEDDSEEDEEDGKDKKPSDSDYQPRLKQFIKDDGKYDLEKIEKSYIESGKQAVQLDKDLKEIRSNYGELLGAIKGNPDIAEKLFGKEGAKQLLENDNIPKGGSPSTGSGQQVDISSHPLLKHLEAQLNAQSKSEYNKFVEDHPEAVTDPTKARQIGEFLQFYGPFYSSQNDGQIAPMKEALEAAYRHYGWDLEVKGKEDLATAAKKTAATRRTPSAKRAATKKEVTQSEQFFANKLGVKLKS